MPIEMPKSTKKVVFVGNSRSGKTGVVRLLLEPAVVDKKYIATVGVVVHKYPNTNANYDLWDCAGLKKFGCGETYIREADLVCIFHGGISGTEAYCTPQEWEEKARKVAPDAEIHHILGTVDEKYEKITEILV